MSIKRSLLGIGITEARSWYLWREALSRVTNMVDAVGITKYAYTAGGQLWTEDGTFASDTVTNTYQNHLRTALSLVGR